MLKVALKVVCGDITQLACDAIVNAANNQLLMGGGVAGIIRQKGGAVIEQEAVAQGPIAVGGAVATSAGTLPCRFVIHAATMAMDFKTSGPIIRQATHSALEKAEELKIGSIVFPALGCGVGGFPLAEAAGIMKEACLKHVEAYPSSSLREIVFCLYNRQAYNIFTNIIE